MGTLIVLLFGFPAVCLSLLLSALGIWKAKYWLTLLGALLFIPFSYYLNGAARGSGWPYLLPLSQALAAGAVSQGRKLWAWLLLAPSGLAALYVLAVVLFVRTM